MDSRLSTPQPDPAEAGTPLPVPGKRIYLCDRCGAPMKEKLCKINCPNCGNRFDCSELNIYFDY